MRYINKQIFKFVIVTVLALIINPCFAMSDETLSMYNQIVSKSNDLDKYIQDIKNSAKQVDKFKQEAQDITENYKKAKQANINKSINNFSELRLKEQKYIDSLPLIQANKEFDDVTILVKAFLPKLQQEEFMINEDYTDQVVAKQLTVTGQTMQKAARYNEELYNLKLYIIQQQQLQQLEERELTIAQINYLNDKIAVQKTKIAGIDAQLTQLEKDTQKSKEQLEAAKRQMQQVINDQKELKKYWWTPFYGFYLTCKNLDNEVNKRYEHALARSNQFAAQLAECQNERNNLHFVLSKLNKEIQNAENDINEYNKSLEFYATQINSLTQIKLKYSNMIVEIGKLINTFEYNSNSIKALLDVIESTTNKESKI